VCEYFCVNIFCKKKKKKKIEFYFALCDQPYTIRSIAETGLRLNSLVFV
jgi:hypothetical protein